jgi:2-phospho-L-lactate transferase/gluconeogenesis factor (CofD/UPF0052 family)
MGDPMKTPASDHSGNIVISVFCGGRGGSNLIREFLRRSDVELYVLINAYDDGLSTGELRDFIPGMLGPSDFRKNLANFLHWHSNHQYALTRLLEFRLPENQLEGEVAALKDWAALGSDASGALMSDKLRSVVHELDRLSPRVRGYLAAFFEYQDCHPQAFKFEDCSIGNLVFAGAYLKCKRNFNATAAELAREFHSRVKLLNVTQGENRILVALKQDGEILEREAKIVGPQSDVRIVDFFLLEKPLAAHELRSLRLLPNVAAKRAALSLLNRPVTISPEAREAILHSDIIVYGPGTQFSSLLPSYKTVGLGEAISVSRACAKIFVSNIHHDHDIRSFSATDIVSHALDLLHDPANEKRSITHVLYTSHSSKPEKLLPRGGGMPEPFAPELKWIDGEFEHPTKGGVHSGYLTVRQIFNAYEEALVPARPELDIYINLYKRSLAVTQLIEEFLELPWQTYFERVRLRFNNVELPPLNLPPHLVIESVRHDEMFSEVVEVSDWASSRSSKYLATISGDGEYRLCDILSGMEILTQHSFAAVYGSRVQSHNQFFNSLDAAYGESPLLHACSLIAGFAFSLLFVLRFGVIFSDPLTGFRLYNRSALARVLDQLTRLDDHSSTGITKILMQNKCEIAEIPISYRTFEGFTSTRWRLSRSFRNARRIFF